MELEARDNRSGTKERSSVRKPHRDPCQEMDPGKSHAVVQGKETRPTKEEGGRDGFIKYSGRAEVGTC